MVLGKNDQKGATMLETLGVLTIIVMLGVSVIKLVGSVYDMLKQNLVTNELKDLQKVISEKSRFEGSYASLFEGCSGDGVCESAAAFVCDQKMAPSQMCSNSLLYHRMGGRVYIASVGEDNKYALIFENISDRACINMAQINWYTQQKSDVYQMVINTDKLIVNLPQNARNGEPQFPVEAADAMSACNQGKENTVQWVFY